MSVNLATELWTLVDATKLSFTYRSTSRFSPASVAIWNSVMKLPPLDGHLSPPRWSVSPVSGGSGVTKLAEAQFGFTDTLTTLDSAEPAIALSS